MLKVIPKQQHRFITSCIRFCSIGFLAILTQIVAAAASAQVLDSYTQPGYFMVIFGARGEPNHPDLSHTWATFVAVQHQAVTEEHTISWMPALNYFGPQNSMPRAAVVPGANYTLDQTVSLMAGRSVLYWGPYEISADLFYRARLRASFLASGGTQYRMLHLHKRARLPALAYQPGGAINCIMAVSDIGGYLETGAAWGFEASRRVLAFLQPWIIGFPLAVRRDVAELIQLRARLSG